MPPSHFPTDPDENAASIVNAAELLFACLDAAGARSVAEVGAFHGKSTRELLGWAEGTGARVVAIDPTPEPALSELAAERSDLELIERTSIEALADLDVDAVILDGDHNYYTLSEELRLIADRAAGGHLPLLIFHDIGWPLARRDAYYAPERIPAEHRQRLVRNVYLVPGEPGTVAGGMPFACVAAREGGPRNGILTAIEDFAAGRDELVFASVPAFFGVGFAWDRGAPWADAVAAVLAPWDRNPMLERLEANRLRQMAERYRITKLLDDLEARSEPRDRLLRTMLGSRAIALAERASAAVRRGEPAFSREQIRAALDEHADR
jgi:predicted O-methyltransferase YrrM